MSVRVFFKSIVSKNTSRFQYNFCVGSRVKNKNVSHYNLVSIQLLCRFEFSSSLLYSIVLKFQYNFCVGSSIAVHMLVNNQLRFQYNFCVGSRIILLKMDILIYVSIQLLCRFENT